MPKIGLLAIQGDFHEHIQALDRLGVESKEIRKPPQLDEVDGLIIPGGESTTIVQLIDIYGFRQALTERVRSGMPLWGTCAGMIVIADRLADRRPEPLHLMDIDVSRNAFGRQIDSFEENIELSEVPGPPFRAVFIRAPGVDRAGDSVKVLAKVGNGRPVAVRQDRILATAFHPELTGDDRVHQLFAGMVERSK